MEEAKGDKDLITAAMDKLQPLITAANIGEHTFLVLVHILPFDLIIRLNLC